MGHHAADIAAAGHDIILRRAGRHQQRFQPAGLLAFGLQFGPAQQIAFTHNPDQPAFGVQHRQAADAVGQHHARRIRDRGGRQHKNGVFIHECCDMHGILLK
jgi:hypothetical protein